MFRSLPVNGLDSSNSDGHHKLISPSIKLPEQQAYNGRHRRQDDAMPFFRLNNNPTHDILRPAPRFMYMTVDQTITLRVNGFHLGKHVNIGATDPRLVNITVKASPRNVEQVLHVKAVSLGTVTLYGKDGAGMSPITLNILSRMQMPQSLSDEQRLLLCVLLAEVRKAGEKGFNPQEAAMSMEYMVQVLRNRLAFSHPHLLGVPKADPTLAGLIKSGQTIQGFQHYPAIEQKQAKTINDFISRDCNVGSGPMMMNNRRLFHRAVEIVRGENLSATYRPALYSWMTYKEKDSPMPGKAFTLALTLQGQNFFGLSPEFLADPLGLKK